MNSVTLPLPNSDQTSPQTAESFIQSGWKAYVQKDYAKSISSFQQAIKLDQRLVDGHYGLGLSYRAQGKSSEALNEFQIALELSRDESTIIDSARRTILRQLIETQIVLLSEKDKLER